MVKDIACRDGASRGVYLKDDGLNVLIFLRLSEMGDDFLNRAAPAGKRQVAGIIGDESPDWNEKDLLLTAALDRVLLQWSRFVGKEGDFRFDAATA